MPKRREIVQSVSAPFSRIRENSRLMRTHETMVDLISGRQSGGSLVDFLASGVFGLDFDMLRNLEDDLIYSDDDDDDNNVPHKPLEPHPRIRQLTEEEADKHAKELIEEEQRRKEKTEKNKRKKMKKKEKKRLEKENAVKKIISEEDQGMSDASENQKDNPVIESKREKSPESDKTQKAAEVVESNDYKNKDDKKQKALKMNKKEDEEQKQDLDLKNSYVSSTESVPEEETCMQPPARARKKQKSKSKLPEVQQPTEKKRKDVLEKPEIQQKTKEEDEEEPDEEKTADEMKKEFTKRSRELAGIGNRLAASGEYHAAVQYFTDAIKCNPKEFKLFGNRSLCFERMQKYERALTDADLALSMEPNWIKGLFRKGKALCGLKKYYEASLVYNKVLELDGSSDEAKQELKRAQTLHLMEIGFTWAQSSDALKMHGSLEDAIESLFATERNPPPPPPPPQDTGQPVRAHSRSRMQQISEQGSIQNRSNSLSPTPWTRNGARPELFPIWVGSLSPTITYATLHDLFSRSGMVFSIKMLLEQQCAFVNYTCRQDCERAIRAFNGMVVEGAPLSVRYPNRSHNGLGASKSASADPYGHGQVPFKKECFFWRTTGCTRSDCTFKHDPLHKNIDRDKFSSRLGNINT